MNDDDRLQNIREELNNYYISNSICEDISCILYVYNKPIFCRVIVETLDGDISKINIRSIFIDTYEFLSNRCTNCDTFVFKNNSNKSSNNSIFHIKYETLAKYLIYSNIGYYNSKVGYIDSGYQIITKETVGIYIDRTYTNNNLNYIEKL